MVAKLADRDLYNVTDYLESLAPASRTAAVNGTGVDTRSRRGVMGVIQRGAAGGTTPSFTFTAQESDDDSTYSAVADADLQGGANGIVVTAAGAAIRRGYIGSKRYVRWAITAASGTSPTLLCSAGFALGYPAQAPV